MTEGTREIGVGLIGAGRMGSVRAAAYRHATARDPDLGVRLRLVIAADPVADRAGAASERYGFEHWSTESAEVIQYSGVAAVGALQTEDALMARPGAVASSSWEPAGQ